MSLSGRIRTSVVTALITGVGALFAAGCGLLSSASTAAASSNMQSMFEDPAIQGANADVTATLQTLRYLGVGILRLPVYWSTVAADPNSYTKPSGNPYTNWATYDQIVNTASRLGIAVDLMPTGGAPLWATKSGAPPCSTVSGNPICFQYDFMPSASLYHQFVQAVAARYRSVHFWEVWNEANWGPSLSPQYYQGSKVPVSAGIYRQLLDAGYSALRGSGHGHDTILFGSLSQDGSAPPVGETQTTAPLIFVRTLYCLNNNYRRLTGAGARQAGCPTSKSGFRHFRGAHPALFSVSGLGLHPYPFIGLPPNRNVFPNADGAEFAEIPQVLRSLDRIQKAYGSRKHLSVYNTEYGYSTRPNQTTSSTATPTQAATFINQAEYLSWKNPRIATFDQYELVDQGWFPVGLFFPQNTQACPGLLPCPKPSFFSYRLPVWLPVTSAKHGKSLEVWGDVRPARYARLDTGQSQNVQIQYAPNGSSSYRTVKSVRITNAYGYFDVRVKFPGSGSVRLAWTYPSGDARLIDPFALITGEPATLADPQAVSRVTTITLH
jgi:hypothetical protein